MAIERTKIDMSSTSGPVLLTTDYSDAARRAYPIAAEWARAVDGEIVLVHVLQTLTEPTGPDDFESELQVERERLTRESDALPDIAKSVRAVAGTNVARTIASLADELSARCIVLSSHGRSGVRHLVLGSNAEEVTRRAHVPVVTVPPSLEEGTA